MSVARKVGNEVHNTPYGHRSPCIVLNLKPRAAITVVITKMIAKIISISIAVAAAVIGVIYQSKIENILFVVVGLGRVIQPIEDFPYDCRRIRHSSLESCEDLWLDDEGRSLYAACGDSLGRLSWAPG